MSDESSYKNDLPISKRSGLNYEDFLDLCNQYLRKIQNYPSQANSKYIITKQDIIVIDDILKEMLNYLKALSEYPLYQLEFNNIFDCGLKILQVLSNFYTQKNVYIYQKLQRIKFFEAKINYLITKEEGKEDDYSQAVELLDEVEKLASDVEIQDYISPISSSDYLLKRAACYFFLKDVDGAHQIALDAIDSLENNWLPTTEKQTDRRDAKKRDELISQTLEFLAQIYDIKGEYEFYFNFFLVLRVQRHVMKEHIT